MSLVSVDCTTVRAHHDAAGMRIGKEVMDALEEAAADQERARQKGAARGNGTDRTEATTAAGKNGGTSGDGASSVCGRSCSAGPVVG